MSSKSKKNTKKTSKKTTNRWWEKSKVTNYGTGVQDRTFENVTLRTWSNDKCLRIIGLDAFRKMGLDDDEARFLTATGDWTCFVDKNGNRLSFNGADQGDTDEKFVFSTALDVITSVISIQILMHKMTDEEGNRYIKLIDKMATNRKDVFKWYFTTNPNCPAYKGDFSDLDIINTVHTYFNEQSEYCVNAYLEQYGLTINNSCVTRTSSF